MGAEQANSNSTPKPIIKKTAKKEKPWSPHAARPPHASASTIPAPPYPAKTEADQTESDKDK